MVVPRGGGARPIPLTQPPPLNRVVVGKEVKMSQPGAPQPAIVQCGMRKRCLIPAGSGSVRVVSVAILQQFSF